MNITVEVEGEEQLNRSFNRVEKVPDDMTGVWKAIQPVFFDIEAEQFDSEGARGASGKWNPLSAKYEEIKVAKYGSMAHIGGVLYATGAMRESLTRKTSNTVEHFGRQEATFGTSLRYGRYHQRGGGRLPQRKAIDLSASQKTRMHKAIQKELLKSIRKDAGKALIMTEGNFKELG